MNVHAILAGTLRKTVSMETLRKELPVRWSDRKSCSGGVTAKKTQVLPPLLWPHLLTGEITLESRSGTEPQWRPISPRVLYVKICSWSPELPRELFR